MVGIPPLPEQKAIAHILGTLDDKIELNRQMNETLEAMVQALFKSWFVDFDPVMDKALAQDNEIPEELQAKAERRKAVKASGAYKTLPQDLMDLFPSSFVYSEDLGKWIPEGWTEITLNDVANVSSAKRVFAKEYKTEGVPFYRGKEISLLSKGSAIQSDVFISKERFEELKNISGAPVSGDIILTSVGTIGNTYLVKSSDEFYFKDGNLTWFSNYKTEIKGDYLMTWFNSKEAHDAIKNITIGSTQQAITITSISGIKIIKASQNILDCFNRIIKIWISKKHVLIEETSSLKKYRDLLLSKLISGKTRLPSSFIEQFESEEELINNK